MEPKGIYNDPEFKSLSPEQKFQVLNEIDPEFKSLSQEQKEQVIIGINDQKEETPVLSGNVEKNDWIDNITGLLPVAGGVTGAIAGAGTPASILLSGVGAGGGEAWRQAIQEMRGKRENADVGKILSEGAWGAGGEAGGNLIGAGLKSAKDPMRKLILALSGLAKDSISTATAQGSKSLNYLKFLKDNGLLKGGRELWEGARSNLNDDLLNIEEKLGKNVGNAKSHLQDAYLRVMNNGLDNVSSYFKKKQRIVRRINKENLNAAIKGSADKTSTFKNKYFELKNALKNEANPTKQAYLQGEFAQAQRNITDEIRNKLTMQKRAFEKQGLDHKEIKSEMYKTLLSEIEKYNLTPDLSEPMTALKEVMSDRQFSGNPISYNVNKIYQELNEGVNPQRAQELMDMLDYDLIDYVKEYPDMKYFVGKIQKSAKSGRAAIDKMLKDLSNDLTGGEYGQAKTEFANLKNIEGQASKLSPVKKGVEDQALLEEAQTNYLRGASKSQIGQPRRNAIEELEKLTGGNYLKQADEIANAETLYKEFDNPLGVPGSRTDLIRKIITFLPKQITEKHILPDLLDKANGIIKPDFIDKIPKGTGAGIGAGVGSFLSPEEQAYENVKKQYKK